jgi:metal transporter CNNM
VKVIKYALYVFSWPLAKALDLALGRELATTYSNAEMIELLNVHVKENIIDQEEANAMAGALTYKNIPVRDAMTGIDKTFMLEVDEKLSFETIGKIFKTGYSRIPVFEISKSNIIGLLFVKDLIFLDPEDSVPVRSFVQIFGRSVHLVWPDDTLGDVLAVLKKGKSHLAVVRDVNNADEKQDPFYEVKGIITLEDIVERIIGDSIVDETDAYVDDKQSVRRDRGETFEWARLRLLDTKIVDEMLSASEIDAITAHLKANHSEPFQMLTDSQLTRLVSSTPVTTYPTATHELDKNLPNELLYEKNVQSDTFTLILSGKVTIFVGSENFRSDVSSWSVLGAKALEDTSWSPDYSAFVSDGPCRCIQIKRESFVAASDASVVERRVVAESETKSLRSQPHASTSYWVSDIVSTTSSNEVYEDAQTTSEQSMEGRVPNRRQDVLARLFPKNENGPIPDGDEHDEDEDDEDEHDDGSESAIQTKLSMDTKKYSL